MKLTLQQQTDYGLIGVKSARKHKGVLTEAEDKAKKESRNAETKLQSKICGWMREQWPDLVFLSDFAAGLKLSPFLANIRAGQSCNDKVPDLYIFGPVKPLIIEIKVSDDNLFLKDGMTLCSEHVQRQYETIKKLRKTCYADFGVGENDIKAMIRGYMLGKVEYTPIRDNPTHLAKLV